MTGALTLSLLVSAASSPFAGRIIDHGHGRILLTGSALCGALLLMLLSQVTALWQFYTVWILLGLAMSGCLYDACFAILTHTMGNQGKTSDYPCDPRRRIGGNRLFPKRQCPGRGIRLA